MEQVQQQQMQGMINAINTQSQKITALQNQVTQLSNNPSVAFNQDIQGTGMNAKDQYQGNLNNNSLAIAQQNFWKNILGSQSTYCSRCGGLAHTEKSACKRRCNLCYGDHNTKDCRQKFNCPWCGAEGGLHNCNNNSYAKLAIRCPLCKTKGHNATECNASFMATARLINVIKSLFKRGRRSKSRRRRRRLRGIKSKGRK